MVACACNPSTLGGQGRWITRSREPDHPGQHGETLSLLKTEKISWWYMPVVPATWDAEAGRIAWTQEAEVAVSWDGATALQPGQQREIPFQKPKKNLRVERQWRWMVLICVHLFTDGEIRDKDSDSLLKDARWALFNSKAPSNSLYSNLVHHTLINAHFGTAILIRRKKYQIPYIKHRS